MINKNYLKNKNKVINYVYKITKCMETISIFKYKLLYKKFIKNSIYRNFFINSLNNLNILNNIYIKNNNFIINKILYLVISTDQGLCGNLNLNLYKNLIYHIKKNNFLNKKIYFFLLGKKSINLINILKLNKINFFILKKYNICDILLNINKYVTKSIINFYNLNKYNNIFIFTNIYKKNKNYYRLLPIINNNKFNYINYIYESNKNKLFNKIVFEYINSNIIFFIINNMLVEYSNRIFIMKNSSFNLNNLSKEINIIYNKFRQFNINKEIMELISILK